MRLAAIDIGSNSLHMIVVHVRSDFSFEVIDREKEMVRLGAGGLDGGTLTPEATRAALQVLSKFKRLAESHAAEEIVAVATSAVREADNGAAFLRTIQQQTGIRARAISGTEEARLIHLAAAYGVGSPGDVSVVVDIGGGSVEITRGPGADVHQGQSFKLGVIRLTERFVETDPITPRAKRRLVHHVEEELGPFLDQLVEAGFTRVVGTSGTALSLGAVTLAHEGRTAGTSLRNRRVSAKALHRVRKLLVDLPLDRRLTVPGLEPRRADIVVAGALLLDTILRRLGATEFVLCDLSLREGLVLDYIARHRDQIAQADRYPDVRLRSVIELADRCQAEIEHARQVARIAGWLFDATRAVHGLTDREREWLEYAALLHDVGAHISYEAHHKHSQYLIRNGDLRGFEPAEIDTIALIARYHRRAAPKRTHREFGTLARPERRVVRALSAILRLAESLDRSHAQAVAGVALDDRDDHAALRIRAAGDVELELWSAARHAGPFERLIGKSLVLEPDAGKRPNGSPNSPSKSGSKSGRGSRGTARFAASGARPPGRPARRGRGAPAAP